MVHTPNLYMADRHHNLYSNESVLVNESQRTLDNGQNKEPIDKLRLLCFSKGSTGILELSRALRKSDDSEDGEIDFEHFSNALKTAGVECSKDDVIEMFASFDEEGTGILSMSSILEKLRPDIHQSRLDIITRAFDKVDVDHKGVISVPDLKHVYSVKVHPKYRSGEMTEAEIWKEFLMHFQNTSDTSGTISREEFINYYASMSASIDNDMYFDLLMRQSYSL